MKRTVACLVLLALGLLGSTASAAVLPPGNSGANQYAETLPGAGGNEATRGPHGLDTERRPESGAAPSGEAVSPQAAAELKELGRVGSATLNLAEGTAPAPLKDGQRKDSQSKHANNGGGAAVEAGDGSSGVSEVLGGLTGTSFAGALGVLQLPIVLMALLIAGGYAVWRRRQKTDHFR